MKPSWLAFIILFVLPALVNAQQVNVEWARHIAGGTQAIFTNESYGIAAASNGDVYTTGYFTGTFDFDPGPGVFNLSTSGLENIYISCLDANGNFKWAKQMVGDQGSVAYSVTTDISNNIYLVGSMRGSVDFDPGIGVNILSSANAAFVCKLSQNGDLIWAKLLGDGGGFIFGYDIAVDAAGNVITCGRQSGGDFDPGPGQLLFTEPGMFISKLNANGDFVWAKQFNTLNTVTYGLVDGLSLETDPLGNIYTTGFYTLNNVDFDPGSGVFMLPFSYPLNPDFTESFVLKLNAAGEFVWAKKIGGSSPTVIMTSLTRQVGSGNIVIGGYFLGVIDVDPGAGTTLFSNTNPNASEGVIIMLDADGEYVWAKQIGNADLPERVIGLATDANGGIYATGDFFGTTDFDPGVGTFNLTAACSNDIFILKLDGAGNFNWAKKMGGGGNDHGNALAIDPSGALLNTGKYQEMGYFDNFFLNAGGFYFISYTQKLSNCTACTNIMCLGGRVWLDINGNGIDDNEPPMAGVEMRIYHDDDNDNQRDDCAYKIVTSNSNGEYSFCNLFPGNYIVGAVILPGYGSSIINGGDPDNNINADDNGQVPDADEIRGLTITLEAGNEPQGNTNNTYDFGMITQPVCNLLLQDNNVLVTNSTCGLSNGSITAVSLQNAIAPVFILWEDAQGNAIGNNLDISNLAAGSYRLKIKDNSICDTIITGYYNIGNIAHMAMDSSAVIVSNSTCGLPNGSITGISLQNALAPVFILWEDAQGNAVGNNLDISNLAAGTYRLKVKDNSLCDTIITGFFTIVTEGEIIIDTQQVVVANSDCGLSNGSITGIIVSGVDNYQWLNAAGIVVGSGIQLTGIPAGAYLLSVSNGFGCAEQTDTFRVFNNPVLPPAQVISNSVSGTCNASNGYINILNFPNPSLYSFRWINTADSLTTIATTLNLSNINAGNFSLFATNAGGCVQLVTTISLPFKPPVVLSSGNMVTTNEICQASNASITGLAAATGTGMAPYRYEWKNSSGSLNSANPSLYNIPEGNYFLIISDADGCSDTSDFIAVTNISETLAPPGYNHQTIPYGTSTNMIPLNAFTGTYYLYSDAAALNPLAQNDTGVFSTGQLFENKTWYIEYKKGGCSSLKERVDIKVLTKPGVYIPTAFTPDSDGKNDQLKALVFGSIQFFEMHIYNRFGQLVFSTKNPSKGWDGTYKGKGQETGNFVWICRYRINNETEQLVKGSSLLIR